ncbi:molybdopterin-dependent oxidoreductase [Rhodoplanes sp. TEM]|uniref:Molybdopterin-dependent oxidoreductase n=1 Tax=Rhodoplanes tepidamans TaxID=200616 RepID=A0ABT5J6C0_RHOTP|nr:MULTISPECIES: molybdopterin cofactor-binding domain-containing protein [Rhodoplanes]MDC7785138.1 molybdopterin-dependent oxidoreductase [Rhodoplanes tepidamans]MDC7982612.1 molybdopterin-dependent oxidoreductase [Rhodoplanes sp. TEM]MDQ0356628.1 CO/xanthine dehydrogenase Mo-binding subunit [Rhodoplanes tepidamans]
MSPVPHVVSRRGVLAGSGALVMSFALARTAFAQDPQEAQNVGEEARKPLPQPGSLKNEPLLDAWIRIDADGRITVFTGKAELGQGIKTALLQVAAEQLDVPFESLTLVTADTARTANEGYTAGSHSMQDSGTAILHASAQVRALLVAAAAGRLGVAADRLRTGGAAVTAPDGRSLSYGEIVTAEMLHVNAAPQSPLKDPADHTVMGRPVPRVDIPAKVTGGAAYVQDMRPTGLVHGRIVRPPSPGARLRAVDAAAVEQMPGVLKVVRNGSFLGVVAEGEWPCIQAMRRLAVLARWEGHSDLPDAATIDQTILKLPSQDTDILDTGHLGAPEGRRFEATFTKPYQMHASIGPSCAIAQATRDGMTVWTHSQGAYPLRDALAEMLQVPPDKVRCIHVEGSGCYGHNGADDVAADAALLAVAVPDRPVRVQWMREDEHRYEPYGPAMVAKLTAVLDRSGRIVDWTHDVWSNTHLTRPGRAGHLLPALYLQQPFTPPPPKPLPQPEGGGDRNAIPLYRFPRGRVTNHFIPDMPLRVSALRSLGAYHNVFAIETFLDDLAAAAGIDPVEFRLNHMEDPRARDVISKTAEAFGWSSAGTRRPGTGRGFGFARYKNLGAYTAVALDLTVDRDSGAVTVGRVVAAVDSGEAVNPSGIRNQIEGAIVQSTSWTLFEAVRFDRTRITSRSWADYPILRFDAVPASVEVHIIDRPGQPFLGTGESGQGPTAAAIANAVADATGVRLRDLPLDRAKVRTALGRRPASRAG